MKQNYIRDKFYNIDNKLVTLSVVCSYIDGQGEKLCRERMYETVALAYLVVEVLSSYLVNIPCRLKEATVYR